SSFCLCVVEPICSYCDVSVLRWDRQVSSRHLRTNCPGTVSSRLVSGVGESPHQDARNRFVHSRNERKRASDRLLLRTVPGSYGNLRHRLHGFCYQRNSLKGALCLESHG